MYLSFFFLVTTQLIGGKGSNLKPGILGEIKVIYCEMSSELKLQT